MKPAKCSRFTCTNIARKYQSGQPVCDEFPHCGECARALIEKLQIYSSPEGRLMGKVLYDFAQARAQRDKT